MDDNAAAIGEARALRARVDEIKASGALVSLLPDGETAWLPAWELYPDLRPQDDFRGRAAGLIGTLIEVVEYRDAIASRRKTVSHVRSANDPWHSVGGWSRGDVKVMEVIATTATRVIGIIRPGVRAEALLAPILEVLRLPTWQQWGTPLIGDELAGFFCPDQVNEQNRVVTLDVAGFIRSRITVSDLLTLYGQAAVAAPPRPDETGPDAHHDPVNLEMRGLRGIDHVLVVDDDQIFGESLAGFLKGLVTHVHLARSYDGAQELIERHGEELDLALIDINVPKSEPGMGEEAEWPDHFGLDLARALCYQYSACSVVLITGEVGDNEDQKVKDAGDLEVSAFAVKPFGVRDLESALAAVHRPPRRIADLLGRLEAAPTAQPDGLPSVRSPLRDALRQLRVDLAAEAVVLYSMDPITYWIAIEASDDPTGHYRTVKSKARYSPVRDIAIDGEEVFAVDASGISDFPKHRWLQRAYGYRSCVGTPVRPRRATPVGYALLAYHRQPATFPEGEAQRRLRLAAQEIGHLLDMEMMQDELSQMKPFELMGKVYGSMAHELSAVLSVDFLLQRLKKTVVGADPSAAQENIRTLQDRFQRAEDILTTFRTMARGQQLDPEVDLDLDQALNQCVCNFRPRAKAGDTKLDYQKERALTARWVRMGRAGLDLIVFNLLLNAVQQIERLRFLRDCPGDILVELSERRDNDGSRWAVVRVHDNGPGIHRRDFRRVFDIHYTTKERGCGMGLDISRNIARLVKNGRGGELEVARSILFAGTTFELVLPSNEEAPQ